MSRYKQTEDTLNTSKPSPNAQERVAIQIGTVDSLAWNGKTKLSKLLGKHSIEHSFTRMARIWCDDNGKPLMDSKTNQPLPAIEVLAELNPGATSPETGEWSPLRIDPHTVQDLLEKIVPKKLIQIFNNSVFNEDKINAPKTKIGVFSQYGPDIHPFVPDTIATQATFIGDRKSAEEKWAAIQIKAIEIFKARLDYHLLDRNCHSVNATLNRENEATVKEFSSRTPIRAGALKHLTNFPDVKDVECSSITEAQTLNRTLHYRLLFLFEEMHGYKNAGDYNNAPFTMPIEEGFRI